MRRFSWTAWLAGLLGLLGAMSDAVAQDVRTHDELVRLVPGDFGLCLVVHNLRGQWERWEKSAWIKALWSSPLGQTIMNDPGFGQLPKIEGELKQRLDLDWRKLREDLLGDTLVLAYRPSQPDLPDAEEGLFIVQARRADVLADTIERINQEQKRVGELKGLESVAYKGLSYQRRVEKNRTHYYLVQGSLLVFASKEGAIQAVIDRMNDKATASPLLEQMRRAGAADALLTLWINPRLMDGELRRKAKAGPEALVLGHFLQYWQALDAVVLTLKLDEPLELGLSLQGRPKDLPAWARRFLDEAGKPSDLWRRFLDPSLLALAGRVDAAALVETLGEFTSPEIRKTLATVLEQHVGNVLGLDVANDILPNIGPDWGVSVSLAGEPGQVPRVVFALAVRPGAKEVAVDQALFKGVHFLASLAVLDHNRKQANPIRLRTVYQEKVDVKYLEGDKVFPPGWRPAFALKEGFLLLASSPEAIQEFRIHGPALPPGGEVPVLHLSLVELAKLVRQHRPLVVEHIAEKNGIAPQAAGVGLDSALAVMDLLDRLEISQRSSSGQAAWLFRVRPRK